MVGRIDQLVDQCTRAKRHGGFVLLNPVALTKKFGFAISEVGPCLELRGEGLD